MPHPAVRFRPPAPELRPYITTYYWVDIPAGCAPVRDWLHPEWPNVRFILEGEWRTSVCDGWERPPPCALFGPTCRTLGVQAEPPARVLGLGFLPHGFAALYDAEAADLVDAVHVFDDHDGEAPGLLDALASTAGCPDAQAARLDAHFLSRLSRRPAASDLMRRAHAALLDPETVTVEALAEALGVSPRHLARLCRRIFGFPPKLLLRRQRFLRTLEAAFAALDRPFAEVLDAAYYDQSYFVRDFHDFMGFSPRAYFALERPLLGVAQRERLKALGASFQDLHAERLRLDP